MEISKIGYTVTVKPSADVNRPGSNPIPTSETSDSVNLSQQAVAIDRYVGAVKSMPQIRSDVVENLHSNVSRGHYPPPSIVDGLTKMIGKALK